MPAKIQGKAHDSPISLFLLWKWVSARGDGARSVPGRGSAAAASDSAVLVQVGSELQRWGAWCGWSCNRNGVGLFLFLHDHLQSSEREERSPPKHRELQRINSSAESNKSTYCVVYCEARCMLGTQNKILEISFLFLF